MQLIPEVHMQLNPESVILQSLLAFIRNLNGLVKIWYC